jgi:uncharacterized membrane protein
MVDVFLARIVRIVVGVVVAIIALALVFVLLDASTSNGLVSTIREWADTLTTPFHHVFSGESAKGTVALNYGLAMLVYLVIAGIIEALLSSATFTGWRRPMPY